MLGVRRPRNADVQHRTGSYPIQAFIGPPWKNVRPKHDRIIRKLEKKYPLHFTIVGRDDGQEATALFEVIKSRIEIFKLRPFDATGIDANLSLEYGSTEGIALPRATFRGAPGGAEGVGATRSSRPHGLRRGRYRTEATLASELHKLCRDHDYTKRFEKALLHDSSKQGRVKKARQSVGSEAEKAPGARPKCVAPTWRAALFKPWTTSGRR